MLNQYYDLAHTIVVAALWHGGEMTHDHEPECREGFGTN